MREFRAGDQRLDVIASSLFSGCCRIKSNLFVVVVVFGV